MKTRYLIILLFFLSLVSHADIRQFCPANSTVYAAEPEKNESRQNSTPAAKQKNPQKTEKNIAKSGISLPEFPPQYKKSQILFDADPTGEKKYLAFPSILQVSPTRVLIAYKRGRAHMMDDSDLELMVYNPVTEAVISRSVLENSKGINTQNCEIMKMPGNNVFVYVDQQKARPPLKRLGIRVFSSSNQGISWEDRKKLGLISGVEYGYVLDEYVDGETVYLIAMTYPELQNSPGRELHIIKTDDNGKTYSFVKNLTQEFGQKLNESTFEKVGNNFIFICRSDAGPTFSFLTDQNFNLLLTRILSREYSSIHAIARPKLFIKDGAYYFICRNIYRSKLFLNLYRIEPQDLTLLSYSILEHPAPYKDSYYAEPYFQDKNGKEYMNIITYASHASDDKPDIVRKEYLWKEISGIDK